MNSTLRRAALALAILASLTACKPAADGAPAVWLVDDTDRVRLAPVRIQRFIDGTVILGDGVEPGQIVVGAGSQMLYPGREVISSSAPGTTE